MFDNEIFDHDSDQSLHDEDDISQMMPNNSIYYTSRNSKPKLSMVSRSQQILDLAERKSKIAKLRMQEFLAIRKEMVIRKKIHRNVILNDNLFFRMVNNKPEIRYRVNRLGIRDLIEKMIDAENKFKIKRKTMLEE